MEIENKPVAEIDILCSIPFTFQISFSGVSNSQEFIGPTLLYLDKIWSLLDDEIAVSVTVGLFTLITGKVRSEFSEFYEGVEIDDNLVHDEVIISINAPVYESKNGRSFCIVTNINPIVKLTEKELLGWSIGSVMALHKYLNRLLPKKWLDDLNFRMAGALALYAGKGTPNPLTLGVVPTIVLSKNRSENE